MSSRKTNDTRRWGRRWMGTCLLGAGLWLAGCEGATFGENAAGNDTFLGAGALAVDHRTDTTFLLQRSTATTSGSSSSSSKAPAAPAKARLVGVKADGTAAALQNLDGATDVRVLFPETGVLVMSEIDGFDRLQLLDKDSLGVLKSRDTQARYHGTRMSPSRKWMAVADNAASGTPLHILDATTLNAQLIPHGGAWLEAMWMRTGDRLAAAVFEAAPLTAKPAPIRLHLWSMAGLQAADFAVDTTGVWVGAEQSIDLGVGMPGLIGTLSWITVSPTDATLAVPLLRAEATGDNGKATAVRAELAVVDLQKGTVHNVADAYGPVSYVADGSTLVAFRPVQPPPAGGAVSGGSDGEAPNNATQRELLLVHLPSMATETVEVPVPGLLSFFVSHSGSWIVMTTTDAGSGYLLHDLSTGTTQRLSQSGGSLQRFVSRPNHDELYLLDGGKLDRLSMAAGTLTPLPLGFVANQINYLPGADRLVLSEQDSERLHFVEPASGAEAFFVDLPAL